MRALNIHICVCVSVCHNTWKNKFEKVFRKLDFINHMCQTGRTEKEEEAERGRVEQKKGGW